MPDMPPTGLQKLQPVQHVNQLPQSSAIVVVADSEKWFNLTA